VNKLRKAFEKGLITDSSGELKQALGAVVLLEETLLKTGKEILELSTLIVEKLSYKLHNQVQPKTSILSNR
jgi:hypothetical protein